MAGSNADITELRHNQEQVKEISSLFKATLDTIPDIIGIQDNNHKILQYNEAGHKFFNRTGSDITGKICFDLMGRVEECRHCAVSQTSSKKVAEELQRSNSLLKAQQESAIDGILIVDENRMVVDFNQRLLDLWNIPKEQASLASSKELLLLVLTNVLNPQSFIDNIETLYKHPTGISRDEIYLLNGKVLDRYTAPVVSPKGICYGRIWFFRDITTIKDNERALKISIEKNELLLQDIVQLDRLKTEFFSNISHELRTPINVIFSTLQLKDLYHQTGENIMNEFQLKYNKIIKQNCYRLLRLINNLIDITKVDAGFYDLTLENHNIVSLIEDITCSVVDYIKNQGLSLTFDTDIEEIMMACDLEKIERILLNLLSNAVKYTKFGGSIHVNIYSLGNKVQISAKDTGMGIPSNKLALIFERFMQVNSSFTRDQEGSGIGLSLVKKLVEMQGGTISVVSTVDQGSEFILMLPVKTVESKALGLNQYVESFNDSRIERINIEFSDIYTL